MTEIKSCPVCGAPGHSFHKDGFYQRDFVCYEKEQPVYHRITVFVQNAVPAVIPMHFSFLSLFPIVLTALVFSPVLFMPLSQNNFLL